MCLDVSGVSCPVLEGMAREDGDVHWDTLA